MHVPVLSKPDFVRRYRAGEFGNASLTWPTVANYLSSSYNGLVHLRNRVKGGSTYYNQTREQVNSRYYGPDEDWYVSAMAPHDLNLLQGEVMRGVWGLELYCSPVVGLPMRDALRELSFSLRGLSAQQILRSKMDELSWQWLEYLLEEYPDHVVEFSCFAKCWGTVPGFNTVFWEVRKY